MLKGNPLLYSWFEAKMIRLLSGKNAGAQILISTRYVTPEFMKTSGIKVIEGRDFQTSDSTDGKRLNVLVSESFEKIMGKERG